MLNNTKQKAYSIAMKYREIILYLFFGFGTTVVNWASYSISVLTIHAGVFLGNIISWILATIFAFVTNKYYVFESRSWEIKIWLREAAKFVSARLLTGIFEIIMVPFLVYFGFDKQVFGIDGMIAKVSVSVAVVVINYFLSKILIFKNKNL